jgi:pimeloyl-ACP methyl ester carboxylesterase
MFLKSDDAEILISGFGQGPRTLVAHGGFVGSGELWFPPFERLSKTWRTVTYDHRGTGATRHSAQAITFELLMADLFRVLDALNIDQCVLAAESMGAIIALEAVLRRPERFTGLVIVDGRYTGQRSPMRDKLIAGCRQDFAATMDGFVEACIPEQGCEAEKAWGKAIVMRSNTKAAIEMLECVEHVELEPRLNKIEIPTLILHGRKDVITPLASSEKLAQQIKHSSLMVHEDAGHVPTVTRPDWVAEQINQFFGQ